MSEPTSSGADAPDYARTLDCIHCGLCLRTCPTYRLTGNETSSPRGRVALMRAVAEGRLDARDEVYGEELEFCLACRHCESVCPAGVRYGEMIEHARAERLALMPPAARVRFVRWLGFGVLLRSRAAISLAHGALRAVQRSGVARGAAANLIGAPFANLPAIPPARERELLAELTPARGARRGDVVLLEGCVMPELFGRVNRATASVLSRLGYDVRTVRDSVCCGALHAHNGDLEGARALARTLIESYEKRATGSAEPQPIVVNSAGCGAHLKELAHLFPGKSAPGEPPHDDSAWRERAAAIARRVVDFSEFVAPRLESLPRPRLASPDAPYRAAYDDPCHLCHGQQIRKEPRAILDRIEGLRRVEMPSSESCCGSAGIYSILRPEDSRAVLAPKLAEFAATGAELLVTANPGCQLQWQSALANAGSRAEVLHVAEVLDRALADR